MIARNPKELQKFCMISRKVHEQLTVLQRIADDNNIVIYNMPKISKMNETLHQYHDRARILEDEARGLVPNGMVPHVH